MDFSGDLPGFVSVPINGPVNMIKTPKKQSQIDVPVRVMPCYLVYIPWGQKVTVTAFKVLHKKKPVT